MLVPIVDLGFFELTFCSIAIAGDMPLMLSTFGLFNFPRIVVHMMTDFQHIFSVLLRIVYQMLNWTFQNLKAQ